MIERQNTSARIERLIRLDFRCVYEPHPESVVVPGVDLAMLCELAAITPTSEATAQLRARLGG